MRPFADRAEAGRRLADELRHLAGGRLVVLGLPRGGVPVAAEVARVLRAPLDVIVVRKLGHPDQPEYAVGALGEQGARILMPAAARVDPGRLADVERAERATLHNRVIALRGGRPPVPLDGRTAIIVDDGIATGATAAAACHVARVRGAERIVLAAPVAPPQAYHELAEVADELVAVLVPPHFTAVGAWYADFTPTTDAEVARALAEAGTVP
ncbi:phosphoribosyltransferase [Hamadaea tsunoensis]|uniref:phosphoribosyltransferase n=1 Tax=Hamadaea tsunoensis TaxID=53368 RepID=UPI000557F42D|nr:phosphoribosyltransferase family protein [Hamadaea tsunoensis]